MRRLLGNPILKIVALVLFTAMTLMLWTNVLTFIKYVNLGVYYESDDFEYNNSELCQEVYNQCVSFETDIELAIIQRFQSDSEMSDLDLSKNIESIIEKKFPNGTNIQFLVRDYKGNELYSTYTKGRPQVAAIYLESYNSYGSSYYNYGYENIYDENGNIVYELGEIVMFVADLENTEIQDTLYDLYRDFYEGRNSRYDVLTSMAISVIGMLILLCWAMASAGYSGKEGPAKLRFYDKIPLEIFVGIYVCLFILATALVHAVAESYYDLEAYINNIMIPAILVAAPLVLYFFISIANRIKTHTFLKNTLTWRLLKILWKVAKWAWEVFVKMCKGLGQILVYVPMFWRTILAFGIYCIVSLLLLIDCFGNYNDFSIILWFAMNILVLGFLCWKAVILHHIKKGGERIYYGDYDTKIDTSIMFLDYKKFAECLNSVGNGLNSAVEERMKSERMKSELITNVSHDLKTPLTSIINYVDLLKNEDRNSPKVDEYLEVLDRQSNRLKKLTEDLIFAAKASSGTEKVNLERINISEFVGQAIAEYSGKTDKAELTVVTAMKISPDTTARADGRLLWRIMDNIFGNVCKYAQPGTRVYVEVTETEKTVTIAVKNISKEQLNISADELMQRFVRGDSSRSSEGSGLGLSISRDLAKLQDGTFDITVDGDLFKSSVTLRKN